MKELQASLIRLATSLTLLMGLMLIPFTGMAMATIHAPHSIAFGTLSNKADAVSKGMEGRLESAYGEVTGDTGRQLKGKAKQMQGSAMDTMEDIKEGAKSAAERVGDAAKKLADDIS